MGFIGRLRIINTEDSHCKCPKVARLTRLSWSGKMGSVQNSVSSSNMVRFYLNSEWR